MNAAMCCNPKYIFILQSHSNTIETVKLLIEYYGTNIYAKNEKNKNFISLLAPSDQLEIIEFIAPITNHRIYMKKLKKYIPEHANSIVMSPNGVRAKLMAIKWKIQFNGNEDLYTELLPTMNKLFTEFGIYDNESLVLKISENMKFMNEN